MSRYIDADALRKAFYKDRVSVCSHVFSLVNPLDSEDLAFEIYNMIDAAPTVDAVPVVRCGECKHWDKWVCDKDGGHECLYNGGAWMKDEFCSDGERKEKDDVKG